MRNNIAHLQRELQAYMMQNNDEMTERTQAMIDAEIAKQARQNLNEIINEENRSLNEIYPEASSTRLDG